MARDEFFLVDPCVPIQRFFPPCILSNRSFASAGLLASHPPGWFRSDFLVGRGRLCWLRVDLRCVPIQPKDLSCCVSRLSCRSVVSSVVQSLPFPFLSGPPRVASFPPTWDGSACRRGAGTKQRLDEEETRGAWRGTDEAGSKSEASERSMGVWQSRGIGNLIPPRGVSSLPSGWVVGVGVTIAHPDKHRTVQTQGPPNEKNTRRVPVAGKR
eukprot:scaffold833_cov352-Pavlova_lutheri.AAC.5